jgi:hypothetical protein
MTSPVERARTWSHELGHSFGLSHLLLRVHFDAVPINQVFSRYVPVMGAIAIETERGLFAPGQASNRLSELELEAIRRVYSSGLRPGSSVADFIARGLITP